MKKLLSTTLKIIAFFAMWIVLLQLCKMDLFKPPGFFGANEALTEVWTQGLAFIAMIIVSIIFIWLVDFGKIVPTLTTAPIRDTLFGIIIGLIWICGTLGLLLLTGSIDFKEWHTIPNLLIWTIAILLNTITIEFMFRGYIFSLLNKKYSAFAAVAIPSFIYVAVHGNALNNGMMSILFVLTASILLSLMRYHTKGMLAPLLAHFVWNFVGGLVIGGVPIGAHYPNMLDKDLNGLALVTGGDAKFEGSALALIVMINLIYLVILLMKDAKEGKGNNKAKA